LNSKSAIYLPIEKLTLKVFQEYLNQLAKQKHLLNLLKTTNKSNNTGITNMSYIRKEIINKRTKQGGIYGEL